jgi:hypothetical protein
LGGWAIPTSTTSFAVKKRTSYGLILVSVSYTLKIDAPDILLQRPLHHRQQLIGSGVLEVGILINAGDVTLIAVTAPMLVSVFGVG